MSRIRAILVDLVGTLVTVRGSVGTQYAALAAQFDIPADSTALDAAFRTSIRSRSPIHYPAGTLREAARMERTWWRELVTDVFALAGAGGPSHARIGPLFEALFAHFGTSSAWEVYPDVVPALVRLRARGLSVGLVTNFDLRVFPLLETTGLRSVFAAVAVPATTGAAKPDAAAFQAVLAQLGVQPAEAAHVGDSIEDDVRAAERVGMTGIWLDRHGRMAPPGVCRITSLEELDRLACLPGPPAAGR